MYLVNRNIQIFKTINSFIRKKNHFVLNSCVRLLIQIHYLNKNSVDMMKLAYLDLHYFQ